MGDVERTGLLRLILKVPAMRGSLQDLYARDACVRALCEAYGDACATLGRFRSDPRATVSHVAEYETLCLEIESDLIERCILHDAVR